MEWAWASRLSGNMRQAVLAEDWLKVAQMAAQIAERLIKVKVPQRHRLGTPWLGAYKKLKADR